MAAADEAVSMPMWRALRGPKRTMMVGMTEASEQYGLLIMPKSATRHSRKWSTAAATETPPAKFQSVQQLNGVLPTCTFDIVPFVGFAAGHGSCTRRSHRCTQP